MNTFMWDSPFTAEHLDKLKRLGVSVIDPVAKKLACGDVGTGAMAAPETIAAATKAALEGLGFVDVAAAVASPAQ
jgi:phosphopantothenoylcysteine decarboxylase